MLRTRVLDGPGLFHELEREWKELVRNAPSATPFQTHEWQSTWFKHYGGSKRPLAYAFYEGNDLVGLFPLVRGSGPWRTLRPLGIGPSDYLHPLTADGYDEAVGTLLAEALLHTKHADLVDLHQLRETTGIARHMHGTSVEQACCLLLDLPATYDHYLQALGKSIRYDVRKLDKSLFSSGKASIEPSPNQEGLDVLFDLHKKRWRKRGLPGAFLGKSVRFHREWAHIAAERGWLWLSTLKLDSHAIGAIYAMTLGNTVYYYQAGFDPEHGSVSPGTLLVAQTIRRSIEEGKRHFDFMRGDEPYKRRWKPQHVLRNLRFIAPAGGLLGRVGTQWNVTGSHLESRVRARLEGKGLL